jgi:3-hydroxyisobutyrate dehydrogenase-like beta-hydroxyacid dehydrogenase
MTDPFAGASAAPSPSPAADREPVTVLGLGPIGTALTDALLRAGHPVTVWNRTAAKAADVAARGARTAPTAAAALAASPVAVVALADYAALASVLSGVDLGGRTLVNLASGTPAEAAAASADATARGAAYLDGAIMVPPHVIGGPDSVVLYSGPGAVFDAHREVLDALGGPRHLGADPGLAVLQNTALLGLMYATVTGFLHAAALTGTAGVRVEEFADLAVGWFLPSVVHPIITAAAPDVDRGRFPGAQGTLEMNRTALEHVIGAGVERGIDSSLPRALADLAARAAARGHGGDNFMSVLDPLRSPEA